VIGIEGSVGDDDVVHEEKTHDFAGLGYLLGEYIVGFAWQRTVARVIMAEGDDGGVVEYGFLDDESNISGSLGDASFGDAGSLDKLEILVHHQ